MTRPTPSAGRTPARALVRRAAALVAFAACAWSSPAAAQMPGFSGPMGGAAKPKPAAPNPNEPQTHAASGASDDLPKVTGAEPSLPADPLAISPEVARRIGTDADPDRETGKGPKTTRTWLGPWYEERSGEYRFRTLFPLWLERDQPKDRASLFGPLYYQRRSTKHDADVLFPLVWKLRDEQTRTLVVGPWAQRDAPGESDRWLAPLFFSGSRPGGGYLHIPPLLTFTRHDEKGGLNIVGPAYCSWKGGSTCNPKTADSIDYGIPPFFFAGSDDRGRYEFFPPLLHYFRYDELDDSALNVWGPLVWKHGKSGDAFHVAPFFFHTWAKNEDHWTLLPLFHYGYEGNAWRTANPLFVYARGDKGETTFATWLYARHRGRTQLDMISPLYWRYEDPDIGLETKIFLPFVYTSKSPRGEEAAFFPFWWHTKKPGLTETTWVTPFVRHTHDIEGWSTSVNPLFHIGRKNDDTWLVVAPFFWDFASPRSRATIGFPLYWRFADQEGVSQLALNTFYREKRVGPGGKALDWEFHFFPAFSYGESPNGHWWNVLYGFAGFTREGTATKVRALWIPIPLSE